MRNPALLKLPQRFGIGVVVLMASGLFGLRRIFHAFGLGGVTTVAFCSQVLAADLKGTAHTIDGDTLVIGRDHVRIQGIAAPEKAEPGGSESTSHMKGLVEGRTITCEDTGERTRGRIVGVCRLPDGRDLGGVMVAAGHARDCPRFSSGRYASAERQAQAAGRDLSKAYPLPKYCQQ